LEYLLAFVLYVAFPRSQESRYSLDYYASSAASYDFQVLLTIAVLLAFIQGLSPFSF
jgi:hypothetical protein